MLDDWSFAEECPLSDRLALIFRSPVAQITIYDDRRKQQSLGHVLPVSDRLHHLFQGAVVDFAPYFYAKIL